MIKGLEEKLENIEKVLSRTEEDTQIYKTYTNIKNKLQKDIEE